MSDKLLPDNLFTSQVAYIRAKENKLISDQDINHLMQCQTYEECVRFLSDKGWGGEEDDTPEKLLSLEREKLWKLMEQLFNDKEMKYFDIFRLSTDFHNLKAAIKESYVQKDVPDVYLSGGTYPAELFRKAAADNDFAALPLPMMRVAEEARGCCFTPEITFVM